jgi:heme/copper-type cytochrome/quinol oxidase subunit 3
VVRLPNSGAAGPPEPSQGVLAEPAEVHERNLWLGARVIAGVTIMFFLAFVFAYFYLRSLNNTGRFRPADVDAPDRYGAAIVLLFTVSAASLVYADQAARRNREWLAAAGVSLALGLAGCVVQAIEYAHVGFRPLAGGWASVFIGWTVFFAVFVLFTMYWVEILLAEGLRNRGVSGVYVPAGLGDAAFYWSVLAAIGVITWAILYLL